MTAHATVPRPPTVWETDDAAPTRMRWEQLRPLPSDCEVTRILTGPQRAGPLPFTEREANLLSETRVQPLRPPPRASEPRRASGPSPFLLTRRIPPPLEHAPPPSEPPAESGPRLIGTRPPDHLWRDESSPWSAPATIAHALVAPPSRGGGLRLVLITCLAFGVTLALLASIATRVFAQGI